MAFSPAVPPKRSGDYTRFATTRASVLLPSTGSIVAVPFTDDWGPLKTPVLLLSFQEYLEVFGQPIDVTAPSEGHVAVYQAFKGGAGAVLAYRNGGSSAAKASKVLAAGATSNAFTLTAKYEGDRGNQYKIGIVENVANSATQRDVTIYYGNVPLRTFSGVSATGIVQLVADINRTLSDQVVASGGTNGTVLDAISPSNLTSGNSGTTLLAADWTTARAALEPQQFGYFAPANLVDDTIQASMVSWAKSLNGAEKSKRFFYLEGGAAGESFSTASARSAAANDENVINLGVGTYRDTSLGSGDGTLLSTAQLVPRLAGALASKGGRASISFTYLDDIEIVAGPSESDIVSALDQGVVVISLGTQGARFERGVTTYTTTSDEDKPFDTYKVIKYVTTMQNFERDGKEANEDGTVLGALPVNDDTREFILDREQTRLNEYIARKEVRPGAKVLLTVDPPPSDDDEFIAIDWVGKFSRTAEQIRRTVYFS
jgi:hypothetical protein